MKKFLLIFTIFFQLTTFSQSWSPLDTGLAYYPYCLLGDSANNRLFAFGPFFYQCQDSTTCPTGIVAWDGMKWENWYKDTIKGGTDKAAYYNGRIYYTLPFYDSLNNDKTYFISFSTQNDLDTIAILDGWQHIEDYCIWNNKLVLIGITEFNNNPTGGLLIFDGNNWMNFGTQSGLATFPGRCTVFNGELYITTANPGNSYFVLKWDNANWIQQGGTFEGSMCYLIDIIPYNNRIYVVGGFFQQDDPSNPGNFIAAWDGSQWSDVGGGTWNSYVIPSGNIFVACVYDNKLFVGGSFTTAGGVETPSFASWNDTLWCGYGEDLLGRSVGDFLVFNGNLYASIVVDTMFGQKFNFIAKWNDVLPDSCGVQWIGISEKNTDNLVSVFPNPASNILNVSFTNQGDLAITLTVFDVFGKEIISKNLGRTQGDLCYPLNIAELTEGIYYVRIQLGDHILTEKFIKQY